MHLSRLVKTSEFAFSAGGNAATFDDVLPDFGPTERVGVVSRTPGSAHRAAGLVLAAVARFYELRLQVSDDFYAYPDFYVFHVGELRGYHGMIDVWPEHKEVVVGGNAESIVSAVNDRGVTRLLIEEAPPAPGLMARETVEGFRQGIRTVYSFDPFGPARPLDDVAVTPSEAGIQAIRQSAEISRSIVGGDLVARLVDGAGAPQSFRRITADEALSVLSGYGDPDPNLTMSERYRRAHALTEADLDRHRYPV